MAENIPHLEREMDIQTHRAQNTPNSLNLSTATLRPFKIKSSEVKDNFKSGKKKERGVIYTGVPIRLWAYFSIETSQAKRERDDILKILKEENLSQEFYTWSSCPSEMEEDKD